MWTHSRRWDESFDQFLPIKFTTVEFHNIDCELGGNMRPCEGVFVVHLLWSCWSNKPPQRHHLMASPSELCGSASYPAFELDQPKLLDFHVATVINFTKYWHNLTHYTVMAWLPLSSLNTKADTHGGKKKEKKKKRSWTVHTSDQIHSNSGDSLRV